MNHHIWRITNALQYKHVVTGCLISVLLLTLIIASACTADKAFTVNPPSEISPTDSDEGWSDEQWRQADEKMIAFRSQFPTDAIPLYWHAWRAYQEGSPDNAISAVREALKLKLEILFPPKPNTPHMPIGNLTGLVKLQNEYAVKVAQAGNTKLALELADLSVDIANHAINGARFKNSSFFGPVGTWMEAMEGKEKILMALGDNQQADQIRYKRNEMCKFIKDRMFPSLDVLDPLINQVEKINSRKDLSDKEKERRLSELEVIYENAATRRNRSWLLMWKAKLASLERSQSSSFPKY